MSTNAVIEIFVKADENKLKIGATFEDKDRNIAFANRIFPEAIYDFITASSDPVQVIPYELETLENRINTFLAEYHNPSGSIIAKLHAILNFVKKNENSYEGIKVYI